MKSGRRITTEHDAEWMASKACPYCKGKPQRAHRFNWTTAKNARCIFSLHFCFSDSGFGSETVDEGAVWSLTKPSELMMRELPCKGWKKMAQYKVWLAPARDVSVVSFVYIHCGFSNKRCWLPELFIIITVSSLPQTRTEKKKKKGQIKNKQKKLFNC